jgi:hypothetical protein
MNGGYKVKSRISVLIGMLIFFTISIAQAIPTEIVVKVKGKGSKFIGSSVGGVRITIKDIKTGTILAEGITEGSTGNTNLIMNTPRKEGEPISDNTSAKFLATIDIEKPTYVEIKAFGPLAYTDSANSVISTQWIFPGKSIKKGDGLLLEMSGFIVDIFDVQDDIFIQQRGKPILIPIKVNISMICGCPILPGGMWDADTLIMNAKIKKDGKLVHEISLTYGGNPSLFIVPLKVYEPGTYTVIVYALNPKNGNSGIDSIDITVNE